MKQLSYFQLTAQLFCAEYESFKPFYDPRAREHKAMACQTVKRATLTPEVLKTVKPNKSGDTSKMNFILKLIKKLHNNTNRNSISFILCTTPHEKCIVEQRWNVSVSACY